MRDDGPTQSPEICMGLAVFRELGHLLSKPKGKASRLGHLFPGVTGLCCGCGTEADETVSHCPPGSWGDTGEEQVGFVGSAPRNLSLMAAPDPAIRMAHVQL